MKRRLSSQTASEKKTLSIMIKKVIVGTEELNLTTNGETRKSLLIIKPSAATCACRGASHILADGEAMKSQSLKRM